jgi:hypothetical protein
MWGNWNPEALLIGMYDDATTTEDNLVSPQKDKHRNGGVAQL